MKAWLKGGLILAIIYFILFVILFVIIQGYNCSESQGYLFTGGGLDTPCLGFALIVLLISSPGLAIIKTVGITAGYLSILIISTLAYFIIGAFIGQLINLIYKKLIKAKK